MNSMKKMFSNKENTKTMITFAVVIAAYAVMQLLGSVGKLSSAVSGYLVPVCAYIVLAVSLNLLVGVCGELSLGHAGFMGIGAFTGVVIAALLQDKIDNTSLRLLISMIGGGALAGVVGLLVGIPVLRLRGDYLAIVTLAFGEIMMNVIGNMYVGTDSSGFRFSIANSKPAFIGTGKWIISGAMGATGLKKISTFTAGFCLILFTLFVVLNLINSKEGRAIKAVRDNRIAAESVGINVTSFRMKAFVVSAFLAGMAGALYGMNYSSLSAAKFNFNTSINILVFVVLGGMGNILGSVISAVVLYILPEAMRGLQDYRMIIYAVVLVVVMLFTWSPKVKEITSVVMAKLVSVLKKKEAGSNE